MRSPQPGPAGPVAYDDGTLTYAVYRPGGKDYCLATYDVASGSGEKGYCAPPREGFSNATVSPSGVGLMTFDDTRPISCRTLVDVDGSETTPVEGAPECTGWETLRTGNGAVWSELPNEKRVERGVFYATFDDAVEELGPGTTGTLTWCGDSAYFVRDAQKDRDKARLLRWTPDERRSRSSTRPRAWATRSSLRPACADGVLTVTAYAEGGDERVWAEGARLSVAPAGRPTRSAGGTGTRRPRTSSPMPVSPAGRPVPSFGRPGRPRPPTRSTSRASSAARPRRPASTTPRPRSVSRTLRARASPGDRCAAPRSRARSSSRPAWRLPAGSSRATRRAR